MSWNLFQPNVNFIVGLNTYDIPITNLRVESGPYSREAGEGTAIRAFDGRFYGVNQGWRTRATFDWPEMTQASQQILYNFIVDLATTGVTTVVFNPAGGGTSVDMVLEDPTEVLKAAFGNNARTRPASFTMVSAGINASAPSWITSDGDEAAIFWKDGNDDYFYTSADTSLTTDPGLDLSSYNITQIDYNDLNQRVYGVGAGIVYSWTAEGLDFRLEFNTGFSDIDGIHIDSASQQAVLTAHEQALFNRRYKKYSLATGTQVFDMEFRAGSTSYSLTKGEWHHGTSKSLFSSSAAVIIGDPSVPEITGLGPIAHVATQDLCIDEISDVVYHLSSPGIYYQSASVVANTGSSSTNDTLLVTVPNNSNYIGIVDLGGTRWLVGGGTDSFRVQINGSNLTTGWAVLGNGIDAMCTRRPLST